MLHRKSWTIIASVLTLAVAGSTAVGQTTYYVNGGCGDDAWTGLSDVCQAPDGPKATIQAAIGPVGSGAGNGDEIIVAPGSYNECINFNGKAITLRSSDGADVTTIDGTGLSCSLVKCENGEGSDTVLEGFTITGGGGDWKSRWRWDVQLQQQPNSVRLHLQPEHHYPGKRWSCLQPPEQPNRD